MNYLNPQQILQSPLARRHQYYLLIIFAIVAVILGSLSYWFIEMRRISITPQKTQTELRAEVATMLQSSQPASTAKISSVSSLLSNSKTAASAEERQSVANMLSK
jgi:cytoskeletal protein RodZ